jgi:hypothetical protein
MATNPIQAQKHLGGIDYPVSRQQLCDHAQANGADADLLETLGRLPDQSFNSPNDVSEAIGKLD